MNNPLGVSPSKGNQGATGGKEKKNNIQIIGWLADHPLNALQIAGRLYRRLQLAVHTRDKNMFCI